MARKKTPKEDTLETEDVLANSTDEDQLEEASIESEVMEEPESLDNPTEISKQKSGRGTGIWIALATSFVIGGAGALWLGPKIAPNLPQGLAPVANFLSPGQADAKDQIAQLRSDLEKRLVELEQRDQTDEFAKRIQDLENRLKSELVALQDQFNSVDGSDVEARLAQLETRLGGVSGQMKSLTEQLANVDTSGMSEEATAQISAYQALYEGLQAELSALSQQQGNLAQKIDDVTTTADRKVEEVEMVATNAEAAQALSDLALALDAGDPFALELETIAKGGASIPQILTDKSTTGIRTQDQLSDAFPELAHSALKASAASETDGSIGSSLRSFLKSQVTIRSLEPQDGDGTDAVLSRVNAALVQADYEAVIEQSGALSEAAIAPLQSWLNDVKTRLDALQALSRLTSSLEG